MKRAGALVAAFALGCALTALGAAWLIRGDGSPLRGAAEVDAAPAPRFHCPMHPQYVSDTQGDCPICGMRLVPIDEPGAEAPAEADTESGVSGYATVSVAAHRLQEIGVRTAPVGRHRLDEEILSVGRVTHDESRLYEVNARVGGWVERLHVDRTGQFVAAGAPLLELYSPALAATQEEYRLAREHLGRLERAGALPAAVEQARKLVADVRRRLELWEIPPDQIRAFEKGGEPVRRVTLVSPAAGYVLEKDVLQGQQVEAGRTLLRIADLSRVWILAEVYESEASRISRGMPAELRLSYVPGTTLRGTVDYVYPYLDPATRTIRVRIVVPNPKLALRPEMYAEVRFEGRAAEPVLAAPTEAVLDTGRRRIAFVALGNGTFEPRELQTGRRTREYVEVLSGLAEGETVVVSGNFLIDSESRLRAALAGMSAPTTEHRH